MRDSVAARAPVTDLRRLQDRIEELEEEVRQLREMLAPGGTLALTAPFDIAAPGAERAGDGPIGWDALAAMTAGGFFDASVGVYWSEEFGYLGPFNTIVTGARL